MFYANDAETVWYDVADTLAHLSFRFFGGHGAIGRQNKVENQIDVRSAFRHSKIVYREIGVHRFCRRLRQSAHFVYGRVVNDDRVEVDGDDTAEFGVHIPFHLVHFFMRDIDIGIGRDFGMERNDLSAGAVIVHHNVVK